MSLGYMTEPRSYARDHVERKSSRTRLFPAPLAADYIDEALYDAHFVDAHFVAVPKFTQLLAPTDSFFQAVNRSARPTVPTIRVSDPDLAITFTKLRTEWKSATESTASVLSKFMHPSYQRIIGMGPSVLPLILESLNESLDHWFWALSAIAGEDPAAGLETLEEAREAWLAWGRERNLLQ